MVAGDAGAGGGAAVEGAEAEDVAAEAQYNLVFQTTLPLNPPPLPNAFVGVHPATCVMFHMISTPSPEKPQLIWGDIVIQSVDGM